VTAQGFTGIESPVATSAEKFGHDRVGELLPGLVECSVVDRHSGRAAVGADVVDASASLIQGAGPEQIDDLGLIGAPVSFGCMGFR